MITLEDGAFCTCEHWSTFQIKLDGNSDCTKDLCGDDFISFDENAGPVAYFLFGALHDMTKRTTKPTIGPLYGPIEPRNTL